MASPSQGYTLTARQAGTKRFCQTLELRDDPELIAAYKQLHDQEHMWQEIIDGIRSVGILEMEIYLLGTRLFMIVETPADFDWIESMTRLATLPGQSRWEELTARYQKAASQAASKDKWQLMERIFHLYR